MSFNSSTSVYVQNNLPVKIRNVVLYHQYSDDPVESKSLGDLAPRARSAEALTAHFNTGVFYYGQDDWYIECTLPDGVKLSSTRYHQCTLNSDDANKSLVFTIDANGFNMNEPSGNCSAAITPDNSYNSFAFIAFRNDFPVRAQINLSHQYGSDATVSHQWASIEPSSVSTDYFVVYFNTGPGHLSTDHWNVEVTLDVQPHDGQPASAFAPWKNATQNKQCMLMAEDVGQLITFSANPTTFTMGIPSGTCTDGLTTPTGRTATAFIQVKNEFAGSSIRKITLNHRFTRSGSFSSQTRGAIAPGKESTALMWVDFDTALGSGWDYWNVGVVLDNGNTYTNSDPEKRCYMTSEDANGILTFSVSSKTFGIGLRSGSCSDGMNQGQPVDLHLGRDISKPYSSNAYLATHNSFANFDDGFIYAQQSMGLKEQFAQGVTTFLLDIWWYDNDIYLLHEYAKVPARALQPFGGFRKLSEGLLDVKACLDAESDAVITIVFEDKVDTAHRASISAAFNAAGVWNQVFFADRPNHGSVTGDNWNVATQGWPTLDWLIKNNLRLIVFSSVKDPFPYQWSYMSENNYGNASLDPKTWIEPRSESPPLNQLPLCAINHFPTWSLTVLSTWIAQITVDNKLSDIMAQINQCHSQYNRWPNYLNLDFFELPDQPGAGAVTLLNRSLHGTPAAPIHTFLGYPTTEAVQVGSANGTWLREAQQRHMEELDKVLGEIRLEPKMLRDGIDQATIQPISNVATMLYGLFASSGANADLDSWAHRHIDDLGGHLEWMDSRVAWESSLHQPDFDLSVLLPFTVMEQMSERRFGVVATARRVCGQRMAADEGFADQHPDVRFSLHLSDMVDGEAEFLRSLRARLETGSSAEAMSASETYSLCHDIFYLTKVGHVRPVSIDSLEAPLRKLVLRELVRRQLLEDRDLLAELLCAYLYIGGDDRPIIRSALRRLEDPEPSSIDRRDACQCGDFSKCEEGSPQEKRGPMGAPFHRSMVSLLALAAAPTV